MYLLAGYVGLDAFLVYRTAFLTKEEAAEALSSDALKEYKFLAPKTLSQVAETVQHVGVENVQMAPASSPTKQESK